MSARRRGLLRLATLLVLLAGGTVAIVASSGGSNPRRAARTVVVVRPVTSTTVSARPRAPRLAVPAAVRRRAAGLPLARQVAQLFLVGTAAGDRDWGGVVVAPGEQVPPTVGQVPPLVAAPLRDVPPPTEPALAKTDRPAAAHDAALQAGAALRRAGVNMVLAPSADVAGESSPVADRAYSDQPAQVAAFTAEALAGYAKAHVIAAVGSFPGEGGASADPNVAQATVGGSLADLRARDLVPFEAVAKRAPAVVVSNSVYAAFDGVTPAVLLPEAIDGVLRRELGFGGVVVSGDLGATIQATGGAIGATAVAALRAGCDLLYVQDDAETAYRAVLAAVRTGRLPRARILASVQRVLALKARYGVTR